MSNIRVLLIDNGDGSASMQECLRNAHSFHFDYREHVCPHPEALTNPLIVRPLDASKAEISEAWMRYCVNAADYDIVFLHTSNAYSMQYFNEMCKGKIVILFTADPGRSWANDLDQGLPPSVGLFRRDEDGGLRFATDFILEYRPDFPPPWDALRGRSAQVKVRERLFQYALECSQKTAQDVEFERMKDLSSEVKLAKQRVEFDTGEKLDGKLFDHPAVQSAVKGELPPEAAGDAFTAIQLALKELCQPKSQKTS